MIRRNREPANPSREAQQMRRRRRWRSIASTPLASDFKRGLATGLATGVLLAVVTLCITLATNNKPSISTLVILSITSVLALAFVGLLPPAINLIYLMDDILMLLRIDVGQLLTDSHWHPDLTISNVRLPPVLDESSSGNEIVVGLQFKELVAHSSHMVTGTATIELRPSFLRVEAKRFELSSSRSSPGPLAMLHFALPSEPFNALELSRVYEFQGYDRELLECHIHLTIIPDWPIRLSPEAKRSIGIDLGSIYVRPLSIKAWFYRMVENDYLTLLPNNLPFNPVIIAPNQDNFGTNIAVASRRWLEEVGSGDREAILLLKLAARMLARNIAHLPEPSRYLEPPSASISSGLASHESDEALTLSEAINLPDLVAMIRDETMQIAALMRDRADARAETGAGAEAYHSARRPCRFVVQDILSQRAEADKEPDTVALIAFEEMPRTHCLLTVGSLVDQLQSARAFPLAKLIDARLAMALNAESNVDASSTDAVLSAEVSSESVPHGISTVPAAQIARGAGQFELVEDYLERLAGLINSSKTILRGAYVQPDSLVDKYWIDLDRASALIQSKGLAEPLLQVVDEVRNLMSAFLRRNDMMIVNCCTGDTALADRRFLPLLGWQSGSSQVVTQSASYSSGYWTVEEWGGDAMIVAALANNWRAFDALMKNLSGRQDIVVFVPVFGPIGSRELDNFESPRGAPGYTLPLLVWDAASATFIPGTASRRFAHMWAGLRRVAESD